MQQQKCSCQITGGNGLKRVYIKINPVRIQPQKVTLYHHAEQEQDKKSAEDFSVGGPLVGLFTVSGQRKRHGCTGHEKKERHHQIPETETEPFSMVELIQNRGYPGQIQMPSQIHENRLEKDQQEQVEATQDVQRSQTGVRSWLKQ